MTQRPPRRVTSLRLRSRPTPKIEAALIAKIEAIESVEALTKLFKTLDAPTRQAHMEAFTAHKKVLESRNPAGEE